MNKYIVKWLGVVGVALGLNACTLIPEYERPTSPVAASWNVKQTQDHEKPATKMTWQEFFISKELRNLIQKGLENNRDLRQAAFNIEVARAQYRITRSDLLPAINAVGAYTKQTDIIVGDTSKGINVTEYNANIASTSFEVDFFGQLRSLNQAALEQYFATEEAAKTVQILLVSEIANAYLNLLSDRAQLEWAQKTLQSQQRSYSLIKSRFEAGIDSKLDLLNAKTLLENADIATASYLRLSLQDKNALELVVGAKISDQEISAVFKNTDHIVAKMDSGLPSDLLYSRPDILKAEYVLKSANADIGAARAAFFPSITLTANNGFASTELAGLFSKGSNAWLFTPQITLPIFNWGRNQANLDVAYLQKEISIAQYEKAIQTAFREVADALIARETLDRELSAQVKRVNATQSAYQLSIARYEEGVDNYLSVLDASRSYYAAEQDWINKHLATLSNFIALYTALGGGSEITPHIESASPVAPTEVLTQNGDIIP
jgi:multidrug efflux system outer membrane protein